MLDVWATVAGQPRSVEFLRRAVIQPVHAYLFSGLSSGGADVAARAFGAALVCRDGGCGECSTCRRVMSARHPDVVEVEPEGSTILVEQAKRIIEAAFRSPVESTRKVIVLHEAERMNAESANRLLKTFEEPPDHTIFVLVTSAPDDLLDTVRSRCQVVAFSSLPAESLRAERLGGPLAVVVEAFAGAPARLDGSGAAVSLTAADLSAAMEAAFAAVKAGQESALAEVETELEGAGYAERDLRRVLKPMVERHKRVETRARADALAEGLATLEAAYRDALLERGVFDPSDALAALDAIADARRAMIPDGQIPVVLNWGLLLESLLLHLPPLQHTASGAVGR